MEVFEVILKGAPYFLIGCITILTYYSYKECQLNSEKKDIANIANIENLSDNEKALRQLQEVALAEYKKECLAESESRMREYEEIKKEKEAFALAEAKDLAEAKAKDLAEAKAKALAEAKAKEQLVIEMEELKEQIVAKERIFIEAKEKFEAKERIFIEAKEKYASLTELKAKTVVELKAKPVIELKAKLVAKEKIVSLTELKGKALVELKAKALAEKKALEESQILAKDLAEFKAVEEDLIAFKTKAEAENLALAEAEIEYKAKMLAEADVAFKARRLKKITEAQVDNKSLKSVLEVDYFNFDFHLILEYLKLCLKYLIPGLYIGILGYLIYIFYKKIKFVYNCWKTKTLKITFLNWLFDPEILFVTSKLGIFYWICMFVSLGILYNISGLGYWFTFLFCGRVFIWNWIKFGIYKLNEKWKNKK